MGHFQGLGPSIATRRLRGPSCKHQENWKTIQIFRGFGDLEKFCWFGEASFGHPRAKLREQRSPVGTMASKKGSCSWRHGRVDNLQLEEKWRNGCFQCVSILKITNDCRSVPQYPNFDHWRRQGDALLLGLVVKDRALPFFKDRD